MADISVTATSVVAASSAQVEHGKAGGTITAGQVVYKDAADGLFKLADHDSATAAVRAAYGIALNGAATGQPVAVARRGQITFNAVLTKGTTYCLSGTAGGICPQADVSTGDDLIILGPALSTTVLDLQINDTGITL
jgi:hypothetical protein